MVPDLTQEILDYLRGRFFGKYRGTVEGNEDTTGRGRLKVKVPAVLGDQAVMAMPCVPYAGAGVGLHLLPEAGTGVWVEFEGGDPSFPIWTGFFWAKDELPEAAKAHLKVLKTKTSKLSIDDDDGTIILENDQGAHLTLTKEIVADAGATLTLKSDTAEMAAGTAKATANGAGVTLEAGGAGKVEVTGAGTTVNSGALEVS